MNIRQKYMLRAIEIAGNGLGTTAPNPSVGAVIVHNDRIIGEGYTSTYGGPHAEVNAVAAVERVSLFGQGSYDNPLTEKSPVENSIIKKSSFDVGAANQNLLQKATLYVTLEPCSHFGKTPPCTDLIIEKGIKTVVIGLRDPYEKVAGRGIGALRNAGIEVITGVLEKECREHHRRFLTFHEKKRPYIILKWAGTSDGFIAPPPHERGENKAPVWISHPYSRQLVHQWRSEEQAILVGTNTVLEDDPKLNVRQWTGRNPTRIVLDRHLKTHTVSEIPKNGPTTGAKPKTGNDYHVLDGSVQTVILTEVQDASRYRKGPDYRILDFSNDIAQNIAHILYGLKIQSVLIEGGAQTLQTFIQAGLWDEARIFEGTSSFKNGIRAPRLSGKLIHSKSIGTDRLSIFRN